MAGSVKEFTDANWKSEVLDSSIPVVIDFWAPWCGPCRMLAPTIEKLAGEFEGKVKVGKMNTDENQDTPPQPPDLGHPHRPGLPGGEGSRSPGRGQFRDQVQGRPWQARRFVNTHDPPSSAPAMAVSEPVHRADVRIKICGLTRVDEALDCIQAGADWIGLNFHPRSPRYVDAGLAAEIVAALPSRAQAVGLFVNRPAGEVAEIADRLGLGTVQLHGDEPPEDLLAPPASPDHSRLPTGRCARMSVA